MKFIQSISLDSKLRTISVLILMSAVCCLLLLYRIIITDQIAYTFLVWNLFLALIPLITSYFCYKYFTKNPHGRFFLIFSLILLWLLFFPNAPYIITDLIHMGPKPNVPKWFDAILLFSFAITGLLCGLVSLYFIHKVINKMIGKILGWIFVAFIILLSSYGIYLGRVLRWNSWDIFFSPFTLLKDTLNELRNQAAIEMALTFTVFLLSIYIVFLSFLNINKKLNSKF